LLLLCVHAATYPQCITTGPRVKHSTHSSNGNVHPMNTHSIPENKKPTILHVNSLPGILYEVKSESLKWKPLPSVRPSVAQYQRLKPLGQFLSSGVPVVDNQRSESPHVTQRRTHVSVSASHIYSPTGPNCCTRYPSVRPSCTPFCYSFYLYVYRDTVRRSESKERLLMSG
jgi:hypothetical protein